MKIIHDLQRYRLEHKISQDKIANRLGVHFVTVNRWLNGHQKPNPIQAYQIEKLIKGEE